VVFQLSILFLAQVVATPELYTLSSKSYQAKDHRRVTLRCVLRSNMGVEPEERLLRGAVPIEGLQNE
jgi:hypothetical protein